MPDGKRAEPPGKVPIPNAPNYVWYSPVEGSSFEGLPPAYIETAEFDRLHDDGILLFENKLDGVIKIAVEP